MLPHRLDVSEPLLDLVINRDSQMLESRICGITHDLFYLRTGSAVEVSLDEATRSHLLSPCIARYYERLAKKEVNELTFLIHAQIYENSDSSELLITYVVVESRSSRIFIHHPLQVSTLLCTVVANVLQTPHHVGISFLEASP